MAEFRRIMRLSTFIVLLNEIITRDLVVVGTQRVGLAQNLPRFNRTDFNGHSTVRGYD